MANPHYPHRVHTEVSEASNSEGNSSRTENGAPSETRSSIVNHTVSWNDDWMPPHFFNRHASPRPEQISDYAGPTPDLTPDYFSNSLKEIKTLGKDGFEPHPCEINEDSGVGMCDLDEDPNDDPGHRLTTYTTNASLASTESASKDPADGIIWSATLPSQVQRNLEGIFHINDPSTNLLNFYKESPSFSNEKNRAKTYMQSDDLVPTSGPGLLPVEATSFARQQLSYQQQQPHIESTFQSAIQADNQDVSLKKPGQPLNRQPALAPNPDPKDHVYEAKNKYKDTQTTYWDAFSATASMQETFIAGLVEDLGRRLSVATHVTDGEVMRKLYSTLPDLLGSFARRIGYMDRSRESGAVMAFITKHRGMITARLEERLSSQKSEMSQDSAPEPERAGKVQNWLHSAHVESPKEYPARPSRNIYDPPDEDPDKKTDELETLQGLRYYHTRITNSAAYIWLLSKIENEMLLVPSEPNHMKAISVSLNYLMNTRYYGMSLIEKITYYVNWDPRAFLRDQEYEEQPEVAFERAVTLTGSGTDAQALTTAQYLSQTWPLLGDDILSVLKRLVRHGISHEEETKTMHDGTELVAYLTKRQLVLKVNGGLDSIMEIGEMIAWLGAALRSSTHEHGAVYCTPLISEEGNSNINIAFKLDTEEVDEHDASIQRESGRCWHNLFQNPVVVKGYPTRRKPQRDIGMEIPIEIMANLAGSNRIFSFARNMFIKSFSTMLVLTKQIGDVFIWHLLYNKNGEHISYADPRIHAISALQTHNVSYSALASGRHVLGWCSNVSNLAGGPKANYQIRWSGLRNSHSKGSLEKLSISGGKFITASFSFALGKKDKPAYMSTKEDYINQLKWISKKFVVLYDVEDKRAWLVDGICTLLHAVRTSLQHDLDDEFTGSSCFKPGQLQEANQALTGKAAAIAVLCNSKNQNLKLHSKLDETHDEETTKKDGSAEGATKTKKAYFCLKDRIQQIYHTLEQIITYQCRNDTEDGLGFEMKPTTREHLEGFDFMDVATDDDPLWRRVTTLKARGRGWIDFVRAIHAPTLFGRGFGEILKPADESSCASWSEVPKKFDYLAVCCSDLHEIFKRHGDMSSDPWRIINDIHWHCPGKAFGPCKCVPSSLSSCDRIQVLVPNSFKNFWGRSIRSPSSFPGSGAVIFGSSRKFPIKWPAQGSAEEGVPGDIDDEPSTSAHDSGLGSSLGSTPQTRSSDDSSSSDDPSSVITPSASDDLSANGNTQSIVNAMYNEENSSGNRPSSGGSALSSTPNLCTGLSSNFPASNECAREDSDASIAMLSRKRKMLEVVDRVLKKRK